MKVARMNVEKFVRVCPGAQACQACQAIMLLSYSFFSISVRDLQAILPQLRTLRSPVSISHITVLRLLYAHILILLHIKSMLDFNTML